MCKSILELGQKLIDLVLAYRQEIVVINMMTLQEIEDYLLSKNIELDPEHTLETNSHIDVWIKDTTNTYKIRGDMWTGVYTFERLNDLEK